MTAAPPVQEPLPFPHRAAMSREDFLVAPCNAEAWAWVERWPDWPGPALCLHGRPGCGKTHLGHVWAERADALIVNGASLATADPPALMAGGRLMVDEGAAVAGDAVAEEALFHLFNMAREDGGHLLILADDPPARWGIRLPDLRSRLVASPAVGIAAPDDALLAALLAKLFADRQLRVDDGLIEYLLARMPRGFDDARRVVEVIDHAAMSRHARITKALAREILAAGEDDGGED